MEEAYWAGIFDAFLSKRGANFKRICLKSETPDWAVIGLTAFLQGEFRRITGGPMARRMEIHSFSTHLAERMFIHSRFSEELT